MIVKLRPVLVLFLALTFCPPGAALAAEKDLRSAVDIEKLCLSLELKTFSNEKKSASTERLARERLVEAGWAQNKDGVFTVRMSNSMLTFRGDEELGHFYVMPFTRYVLPEKNPRPSATGSFVVVSENLETNNYAKMSGFGYIGRGSHTKGERYGLLPFNSDFIRLLTRDKITTYIFTITGINAEKFMAQRREFELFLKCRFSDKTQDYIRKQSNVKTSSSESSNSRRIAEYMLCVDVVGAFVYNSKTGRVVREWAIQP